MIPFVDRPSAYPLHEMVLHTSIGLDARTICQRSGLAYTELDDPDVDSTYSVAQFHLLAGASLTTHQNAPFERYFSFTVASNLPAGGLGNGDFPKP